MNNIFLISRSNLQSTPYKSDADQIRELLGFRTSGLMKFIGIVEEDDSITLVKSNIGGNSIPRSRLLGLMNTKPAPHTHPADMYFKEGPDFAIAHLIEEASEVIKAGAKSQKWGLGSVNPEVPLEDRETNEDWLCREVVGLEAAISRFWEGL